MRAIFFPIKWRSSPGQTIVNYGQTNPTSQFNIVEHCWMQHVELVLNEVLNKVWFPSNISCNVVQHFCTRARVWKSSARHGQRVVWPKIRGHYSSLIFDLNSSGLHHTTCCTRLVMQSNNEHHPTKLNSTMLNDIAFVWSGLNGHVTPSL